MEFYRFRHPVLVIHDGRPNKGLRTWDEHDRSVGVGVCGAEGEGVFGEVFEGLKDWMHHDTTAPFHHHTIGKEESHLSWLLREGWQPKLFYLTLWKDLTVICSNIFFSDHIISQMFRRNIPLDEVKFILNKGTVIREYVDDKPYPSCLLLGFIGLRPLHLLVAKDNESGNCAMVTVYEPDKNIWSTDYTTKIR